MEANRRDEVWGDLRGGYARVLLTTVACPRDQILHFLAAEPGVQYIVDVEFFVAVDDNRRGGGYFFASEKGIMSVGFEEGNVEDRMVTAPRRR